MAMAEAMAEARAGRVAWSRWIEVCQVAPWGPGVALEGNFGWLADCACRRRMVRCILIAHFTVSQRNDSRRSSRYPFCFLGEEVLRAPLRRAVCVDFGGQVFTPSCPRLANYPRRPASDPCVRIPAFARGCEGCCGRQSSAAVDAPILYALLADLTSPFPSIIFLH